MKEDLGGYPQQKDMKSPYMSFVPYVRHWGLWTNFLKDIGVMGE